MGHISSEGGKTGSPVSWVLLLIVVFLHSLPVYAAKEDSGIQRMRLPVGSYFIGGGGGSTGGGGGNGNLARQNGGPNASSYGGGIAGSPSFGGTPVQPPPSTKASAFGVEGGGYAAKIPAHCIDKDSDAPTLSDRGVMTGWGAGLVIRQLKNGKQVDERTLSEAIGGEDPWISIGGLDTLWGGDPRSLLVHVEKEGFDYILEAPSGAVFADDQGLAQATHQEIQRNEELTEGLAMLDAIVGDFRKHDVDPKLTEWFRSFKQRGIEWELFAETKDRPSTIGEIQFEKRYLDEKLFRFLLVAADWLSPAAIAILIHHLSQSEGMANSIALVEAIRSDRDFFSTLNELEQHRSSYDVSLVPRIFDLVDRGMPVSTAIREELLAGGPADLTIVNDPVLLALGSGDFNVARVVALLKLAGIPNPRIVPTVYLVSWGSRVVVWGYDSEGNTYNELFSGLPTDVELQGLGIDIENTRFVSDELDVIALSETVQYEIYSLDEIYKQARLSGTRVAEVGGGKELTGAIRASTKARYLNLEATWGDTVLVSTSVGAGGGGKDTIVVDTGNAGDGFINRMLVAMEGEERKKIRLLITHTDADHIRGAEKILTDARFEVVEIIIGTDGAELSKIAARVVSLLEDDPKYRHGAAYGPTLYHFVETSTEVSDEAVVQRELDLDGLNHYFVRSGTSKIDIYQMSRPKTRNDSGLFFEIREAGRTQLLTDDGTASSLGALLSSENVNVEAGVLKWPHHIWYPESDPAKLNVLRSMLEKTNPHTIILTNKGARQSDENVEKIKRFIFEVLGPHVRVMHTTTDGTLDVSSMERSLFHWRRGRSEIGHRLDFARVLARDSHSTANT